MINSGQPQVFYYDEHNFKSDGLFFWINNYNNYLYFNLYTPPKHTHTQIYIYIRPLKPTEEQDDTEYPPTSAQFQVPDSQKTTAIAGTTVPASTTERAVDCSTINTAGACGVTSNCKWSGSRGCGYLWTTTTTTTVSHCVDERGASHCAAIVQSGLCGQASFGNVCRRSCGTIIF